MLGTQLPRGDLCLSMAITWLPMSRASAAGSVEATEARLLRPAAAAAPLLRRGRGGAGDAARGPPTPRRRAAVQHHGCIAQRPLAAPAKQKDNCLEVLRTAHVMLSGEISCLRAEIFIVIGAIWVEKLCAEYA